MTFQDIFKNSFLENMTDFSPLDMGITLLLSLLVGVFIFQVYKKCYQNVVYTKSFNISLVMMTMVTSLVIMAVTSNIVLSLGMVGALSIVRFRAAIKDPMDIVFMFWSIAVGIVIGAGFYLLGIVGSFVIGIVIYVFNLNIKNESPYLLLINLDKADLEPQVLKRIKQETGRYYVKSKIINSDQIELAIELRLKEGEMGFINELKQIESVTQATLVSSSEFSA
ncbi:MAG: DUF4956 domain-containing protein [Bacteroidetes bacterium]|nr:DUF4956 domain-containing protein [Bacteroidota bacterium]